ncbi:MAG: hypothetical protein U5L95_03260 [Candidatus Saccharibacteria bacterium]|nr:hypothetical protein [Candidatus Saccharibacteria bacterium]
MGRYWFKRRRYGYDWIPVTWQGWLVIAIYLVLILLGSLFLAREGDDPSAGDLLVFFTTLFVATGTLLVVTFYTGPKPKWRWGRRPGDTPREDF